MNFYNVHKFLGGLRTFKMVEKMLKKIHTRTAFPCQSICLIFHLLSWSQVPIHALKRPKLTKSEKEQIIQRIDDFFYIHGVGYLHWVAERQTIASNEIVAEEAMGSPIIRLFMHSHNLNIELKTCKKKYKKTEFLGKIL